MSKILRVSNGDYRIKVQDAGTITLDTGVNTGTVIITGNLNVQGDTTYINVSDLQIEDNIILLNKGEKGLGVTLEYSGIQVQRSPNSSNTSYPDAQFLWDEALGKFVIKTTDGILQGITVGNVSTNPANNLEFDMQGGGGVLTITNSTGYESRVTNPNDVPNLQYLFDYVAAYGGSAVVDKFFSPTSASPGTENALGIATAIGITFYVKAGLTGLQERARVTNGGLDVDNVNIYTDTIKNSGTSNLILTATNAHVEVDGYLDLTDRGSIPSPSGSTSIVYSMETAAEANPVLYNSGLFVTNGRTSDEIVVKNRALLLSMLF